MGIVMYYNLPGLRLMFLLNDDRRMMSETWNLFFIPAASSNKPQSDEGDADSPRE